MSGVEKILIVRVGLGGDLVMITPALNGLLAAFPRAEFHLLTSSEGQRVMKGYDRRITRFWQYHRRFPKRLLLERSLLRELKSENYSRVYVFETRPFYRKWLRVIAPDLYGLDSNKSGGHYCNHCMDVVDSSLDTPIDRGWVTLPVTDEGAAKADGLLSANGIDSDTLLIGLHPTFSGSSFGFFRDQKGRRHREWPQENFAQLARLLQDKLKHHERKLALLIDALPEDRSIVEHIVRQSENSITMLCEPPDFQRYKGLLKRLDLLVAPNTGPMHFAAGLGTRVVGLFSDWAVEDCGPFIPATQFEVLEASKTTNPELGLVAITPEHVSEAVCRVLAL